MNLFPGLKQEKEKLDKRGEERRGEGDWRRAMMMMMMNMKVVSSSALLLVFLAAHSHANLLSHHPLEIECSKKCIVENCNGASIRYGKYCGLGYTGCPGQKPCDAADACCQIHDDCVGKHGLMNVTCNRRFEGCINKVSKSGKVGFSRKCPYEVALPTMRNFMDLAIILGDLGPKLNI